MQFVYHSHAGDETLHVDVKAYEHLFKVRRIGIGTTLFWRNASDDILYEYVLESIGKKEALLRLTHQTYAPVFSARSLHVGWSIVDPKIVEKTLPMLNELGVEKIIFFYAEFSQKQFKLDRERMERIVINSSQQCGRSRLVQFEMLPTLKAFLSAYPEATIIDFSERKLTAHDDVQTLVVGPEGGFSDKERAMFDAHRILGLSCSSILRSETAVTAAVSKILA